MAFETFNLGNVIQQGEQIKGLRLKNALAQQEQDPSSLQNQLLRQNVDIGAEQLKQARQQNTSQQKAQADAGETEKLYFLHDQLSFLSKNPQKYQEVSAELQAKGLPPLQATPTTPPEQISQNANAELAKLTDHLERIRNRSAKPVELSPGSTYLDPFIQKPISAPALPGMSKSGEVQSASILPNGLTQIVYKNGNVEVKRLNEKDSTAVIEAQRFGTAVQGQRASAREGGTQASKESTKMFDKLSAVRSNISVGEDVLSAIDSGAQSGVIYSKLPSLRTASIKLDNLKGRLGLGVISSTTFGALSEAELKFALDTALPTKLKPEELRKWVVDKNAAQTKLANILEDAAIYLGEPGNTVSGWVKLQKEKNGQQTNPASIPVRGTSIDDLVNKYAK